MQEMTLHIYNTLSRKKEVFVPVEDSKVTMYVCGMTVYSDAHIGHARTYVAFDVIRRYFEYKGNTVLYVQNVTDVDDKIIAAANKKGIDPLVYSQRFTDRCLTDLDALGVRRADLYPKASEAIPEMIQMIDQIITHGYGYVADGDVYFSVEKFSDYGKLSGQNIAEMKKGARIEPGDQKHNPLDFALWKKAKPGEPIWQSPWGAGRPGWHIECSAMSCSILGPTFDIHGGGMDLQFPHHENEVAQAEAATGKQFARYWMHIGLLTINGEKMSKSIGNIINVKDLLQTWDAEVLRMFFAQAHYRSPPDFSEKALTDIEKGRERLHRVKERLEECAKGAAQKKRNLAMVQESEKSYMTTIQHLQEEFEEAMDDDFNTPKAFASLFEFVNKSNRFFEQHSHPDPDLCKHALDVYLRIGSVLTLFQPTTNIVQKKDSEVTGALQEQLQSCGKTIETPTIDALMQTLLMTREEARKNKDYKTADRIRKNLEQLGFEIQDTADGPVWRKK
ncbi:MAG TPA: cysteine--tRNA ligase [Candidatus Thermoplasmatota archaeon]|nr:cysteine--tRNA ligase [Candidatus Thermoplasmatota archaeon]